MAESVGAADIRAEALLYLGCAKFDLGDGTGIEDARESLAVAKSINSALLINRVLNNLSILLRADGRVHESHEAAEEALAVAERFGLRASLQFARGASRFATTSRAAGRRASARRTRSSRRLHPASTRATWKGRS